MHHEGKFLLGGFGATELEDCLKEGLGEARICQSRTGETQSLVSCTRLGGGGKGCKDLGGNQKPY